MDVYKFIFALTVASVCLHVTAGSKLKLPGIFTRDFECTQAGFVCRNCYESVYCLQYPDGSFHEDVNMVCPQGTTCSELTGQCSTEANLNCESPVTFQCHQPGVFPDVQNCNIYHICAEDASGRLVSIEGKCSTQWVFDIKTLRCTKKLEEAKCPELVPSCQTLYQTGPIPSNPSFYYICMERDIGSGKLVLYPEVFVCPYNFVYDGKMCVDPAPSTGLDSDGKCIATGKFVHPSNCKKYVECKKVGDKPSDHSCLFGRKFIPATGSCSDFNCENCNNH